MFFMHMPIATGFVRGCRKNYVKWGKFRSGAKDNPPPHLLSSAAIVFISREPTPDNPDKSNNLQRALQRHFINKSRGSNAPGGRNRKQNFHSRDDSR